MAMHMLVSTMSALGMVSVASNEQTVLASVLFTAISIIQLCQDRLSGGSGYLNCDLMSQMMCFRGLACRLI